MDKPVGLTKSAGFQIGVRRTLPMTQEKAWELLFSQEGLQIWLGDLSSFPLQKGEEVQDPARHFWRNTRSQAKGTASYDFTEE
jgi:hypothetical protein